MQFSQTNSPKRIRDKLAAAAATFALLAAGTLSFSATSASASPPGRSSAALAAALGGDLNRYLADRRTPEHISAVSLRVTFAGSRPPISMATGTTRYNGGPPVAAGALWQIGSNTKAFTALIILQLEAEGKLSISDPIGTWLPQYPAWRHITVRQLLDMTSRIPDYLYQPAFAIAFAANQDTRFTAARLVSYVAGLPLGPAGYHYTNTDYILAQMIIEKITHDSYADQLTETDHYATGAAHHVPGALYLSGGRRRPGAAGYFYIAGEVPSLMGKPMPPLALTWAQGAGGIVSSLADMTTWDRDLYQGRLLPARQQQQLESLVSVATGQPIGGTTVADPSGYGLGVAQQTSPQTGPFWYYQGQALGARVLQMYFPRSGMIIALAVNSSTDNDHLSDLAGSVYQTLLGAGAASTG